MSSTMTNRRIFIAALSVATSLAMADRSAAAEPVTPEKCFGVAAAGNNDCATKSGTHSCARMSRHDYAKEDWKKVPQGECLKMGGSLSAPK
ncbi:MAG: hypothetical protein RLZZ08_838 [Pseudomonadota bacterium]